MRHSNRTSARRLTEAIIPKLDKAAEFLDISISELVVRFMSSFTEEQWIEVARKAKP